MTIKENYLRGRVLLPNANNGFDYIPDAIIAIQSGKIQSIEKATPQTQSPITYPNGVILPGFVDSHLHFPQTRITGSASGPLLPWLNTSVFPEESKFSDIEYAQMVAKEFCDHLIRSGTTSAVIFSSSHREAADVLFTEASNRGLKAMIGMTLMNRNAPQSLIHTTEQAKRDSLFLIDKWHNQDHGRLRFCITPRFAISCTPQMLEMAGQLAADHHLWVQSHLSENKDEIAYTMELFPKHPNYLSVYKDFGLLTAKSIYAHCIHLTDQEWRDFIEAGACVGHCPDSNFFLGSGCMPLAKAAKMGAKITLGSDIGAGRTFSMRTIAGRGYDASLMVQDVVSPEHLLYWSTVAGHQHLQFAGGLSPGQDADICVIKVPHYDNKKQIIDAILFRHDHPEAIATYVRGKKLT